MITRVGNNCYCLKVNGQRFYIEAHSRVSAFDSYNAEKHFFTRITGGYKFSTIFKRYGINYDWWSRPELANLLMDIVGYNIGFHWNGCPYFKSKADLFSFFIELDKRTNNYKRSNFVDLTSVL